MYAYDVGWRYLIREVYLYYLIRTRYLAPEGQIKLEVGVNDCLLWEVVLAGVCEAKRKKKKSCAPWVFIW